MLFWIRIPVLFGTRAPQGSRRPVDSTSPSTARVSCITRACPPTPRRRLRALEPPARSSPPISNDSPPRPPSQPRPTGAWAVRGRVSLCAASSKDIRALFPPAGVCWGALFVTGHAEMCADPPNVNVGLCSVHGTPQRDHHGGWGWPLVVRSVPLGYVSQPQAVPGLSAPQRERTKTEAATAFALLPRPAKCRYKPA